MMRSRRIYLVALAWLVLLLPSRLAAQDGSGMYVSGGVLLDVKRFSGHPDDNVLDGESAGGVLALGAHLSPRWSLAVSVDIPAASEVREDREIILRLVRVDVQTVTRNRAVSVAALAHFTPSDEGRIRVGYLAGLSFLALRERFETIAPGLPDALVPEPSETIDYVAAPTVGIDALIPLSGHLGIVPALHATIFRGRESSGLLIRPRVSARWTF